MVQNQLALLPIPLVMDVDAPSTPSSPPSHQPQASVPAPRPLAQPTANMNKCVDAADPPSNLSTSCHPDGACPTPSKSFSRIFTDKKNVERALPSLSAMNSPGKSDTLSKPPPPPHAPRPPPVLHTTAIMFSADYVRSLTYLGNRPASTADPSSTDPSRLTIHGDRDLLLSSLLTTYILPPLMKMNLIKPVSPMRAGYDHLKKFHKKEYLDCIKNGAKWVERERAKEAEEAQDNEDTENRYQQAYSSKRCRHRSLCLSVFNIRPSPQPF